MRLIGGSVPIIPRIGAGPFVLGAAIVLGATLVATLSPLRAAARIDPAHALRAE
jgi:ABC-type antimicrobial peptide transport system permease subunit